MADSMTLNEDFNKAHHHAIFQQIFSAFRWSNPNLLSLYEVTKLIKPEAEAYKGMQTIPVAKIIGSENRYHDFSSAFYPKNIRLQTRWESVDAARIDDVILPPISVYKLGDVYFVRDGNHRVSVARSQGVEFIDAEVVELTSKIPLEEGMTLNEIRKRVVEYERERFIEQFEPDYLPMDRIVFTTPGSYPEMVNHILVHKYYANQDRDDEMTFAEGAKSWYENVYLKVVHAIEQEHLLIDFPGQTEADMYMWLVRRWDSMKRTDAKATELDAAKAAKEEYKDHALRRWFRYMRQKLSRK
ncbi:MAG: transcriptional regulator [Spirochaetales bacterium]|nr:transcriptional regulator [Spirochaetales bacterium]MBO6049440.1 transcriptional regulator [Spirochaetales bacterium]MBP5756347.1 transcriptional regulator [Spirochaetales bacterium]